jgi:hypothetical protein
MTGLKRKLFELLIGVLFILSVLYSLGSVYVTMMDLYIYFLVLLVALYMLIGEIDKEKTGGISEHTEKPNKEKFKEKNRRIREKYELSD